MKLMCNKLFFLIFIILFSAKELNARNIEDKPRVIVTTDGEADDRASMVRFLLTANEFDIEGIINSSSQFHWEGGKGWNAFHPVSWIEEYINLYGEVYQNLLLHDSDYPSPEFLKSKWKVGNIKGNGEDNTRTEGAELIANVLLDKSDARPVWIQAWGGVNTISRALRIIQEEHPERMKEVAGKMRLFLIWEQDETYQNYIRPNWEHYNIPIIISDQFDSMAYIWHKVLPEDIQVFFKAEWMTKNIIKGHGALCSVYENNQGAFNAEGDTPSFLYNIPNGLRSMDSPGYGGWGGRYKKIRNNVWMDPLPDSTYAYPNGQRSIHNSWSKQMENDTLSKKVAIRAKYFKPIWRWLDDVQNEFAARADWCVNDYSSANHHPEIILKRKMLNIEASPGDQITLDAGKSKDPDNDNLFFSWWHYNEADSYNGKTIPKSDLARTTITIPLDAKYGDTIHMICEVSDSGAPPLTSYKRIIIRMKK